MPVCPVNKKRFKKEPRPVPPFCIQTLQKNTIAIPPPKMNLMAPQPYKVTPFRAKFDRNEIPIRRKAGADKTALLWKEPPESLDYHELLPMFIEGLREVEEPYVTIALCSVRDMIKAAPQKVLEIIPILVAPFKKNLETKVPIVVCNTLRTLQKIVKNVELAGEALVPYYRQLLPMMNVLKDVNLNLGDGVDFTQQKGENVGDVVVQTLEVLEQTGGVDAFINIKYMVPTYESCMIC